MAYKKADLEKQALAAIKKNRLKFLTHLEAFLPCSMHTIYDHKLHESQTIKKAIADNRISAKAKALNRWENSKNPTLEIAFYKLIGDEDEVERLGGKQKIEHSGEMTQNVELVVVEPK
jgi:hypothetical protein